MLFYNRFKSKFLKFILFVCIIIYFSVFNIHEKSTYRISFTINVTRVNNKTKTCTVILRNGIGRLGNLLFQFATAYGLSLDHSCHLFISPDLIKHLGQYFSINLPNLLTESELNRTSSIQELYNHCTYFPKLLHPNTSQSIDLIGYWQVHKYFINHTEELLEQLAFTKTILDQAKNFIHSKMNRNLSSLVGIHIRRGDFVGARTISSDKFIFDAMNYFIGKYHSVYFIIVSDDKSYCQKVFGQRNNTFITSDSFTPAEDMAILTLCDHLIITVGTYGWWGAFLLHNRTGEVITDSKPDHTPLDVDCERSIFFPDWFSFLNKTK